MLSIKVSDEQYLGYQYSLCVYKIMNGLFSEIVFLFGQFLVISISSNSHN